MQDNLVTNAFLNGLVNVYQNNKGYKSGVDAVLLASIVDAIAGDRILDVGCGVGVAGLCLAKRIPNIEILGLEKNEYFFSLAVKNQQLNISESSFFPVLGNVLTYTFSDLFDSILMNPPYYKNNLNESDRTLKQQGNMEDDATLNDFIRFAFKSLRNKGYLYLINHISRLKDTLDLLTYKHWGNIEIFPIYSFVDAPAKRFIIKTKKLGAKELELSNGIILHNADKSYTTRAQNILRHKASFFNNSN